MSSASFDLDPIGYLDESRNLAEELERARNEADFAYAQVAALQDLLEAAERKCDAYMQDATRYQYLRRGGVTRLDFERDATGRRDYGGGDDFDANVDRNMDIDNFLGIR